MKKIPKKRGRLVSDKFPASAKVPKPVGPSSWVTRPWFLAVSVILLLIIAFIVILSKSRRDPPSPRRLPIDTRPNATTIPPPASRGAPLTKPLIELPVVPINFETQDEQQRLLTSVEEAVKEFPTQLQFLHIAAQTYGELLQTTRAIELYDRAVSTAGCPADLVEAYAATLIQIGQPARAISVLEKTVALGNTPASILSSLGHAYVQLGEPEEGVRILTEALTTFPQDTSVRMRLAQAQVQTGDYAQAELNARLAMEQGENDRGLLLARSTALMRIGKKEKALELRNLIPPIEPKLSPDDNKFQEFFRGFASHSYASLASAYLGQGELCKAEDLLLHALALDPNSLESTVVLADVLRRQGRIADAIQVHDRLITLQPSNAQNYSNLASLATSLGRFELADDALRRGVAVDPSGPSDLLYAQFQFGMGELEIAARHAQIGADKLQNVDAYLLLSSVLQAQGNASQAVKALLKAKEIAPHDPRLNAL